MGNIANKIDAKDKKLSEVLTGQRYRIDSFQREYRWQRKQIEALISDLSMSFNKNYKDNHTIKDCGGYDCYYMGPIVLCDDKNELSIVDGQQRLTSFTLLIIFLLHEQNKNFPNDDSKRNLKSYLYVNKGGETTLILNVKSRNKVIEHLLNNPNTIYNDIEDLENESEKDIVENFQNYKKDESITNIIERYEDITKLFPEDINNKIVLPIFIEWLLDKVVMVEVKAFSMENAYTIFETMNDRGLSLNPTEILKAFLLHKIEDEVKSDEMNDFWKGRISELNSISQVDIDSEFFKAWLRAKYADSKRSTKKDPENVDFELIGSQFHTWVKNNPDKTFLKEPMDYYYFIRSDFDFYSTVYMQLYKYKNKSYGGFEKLYTSNFYPIADSLSYPLFISSISKLDELHVIDKKINIINSFLDYYTNSRTIQGKAITQSSIRGYIYELIRGVRNLEINDLILLLKIEIDKSSVQFESLHRMDNWGYYHYFYARIINYFDNSNDFSQLIRNRKQSSYVLLNIFHPEEKPNEIPEIIWNTHINSVANFCLVKRYDLEHIYPKKTNTRIKYIIKQGYLPEMEGIEFIDVIDFIEKRDDVIKDLINNIWFFNYSY